VNIGELNVANLPQKTEEAQREQRRLTVAANILAGATYRQIAEALQISVGTVTNDMAIIMDRWKAEQTKAIDHKRQIELQRLDVVHNAIWQQVLAGDLAAVDRYVSIVNTRAKLLGLYMPNKVAPTTPDGEHAYDPLASVREFDLLMARMVGRTDGSNDHGESERANGYVIESPTAD
jgi:Homeodomain-like domain